MPERGAQRVDRHLGEAVAPPWLLARRAAVRALGPRRRHARARRGRCSARSAAAASPRRRRRGRGAVLVYIATRPSRSPSITWASQSGRSQASRVLCRREQRSSSSRTRPGLGSALCRTWCSMSNCSSSRQTSWPPVLQRAVRVLEEQRRDLVDVAHLLVHLAGVAAPGALGLLEQLQPADVHRHAAVLGEQERRGRGIDRSDQRTPFVRRDGTAGRPQARLGARLSTAGVGYGVHARRPSRARRSRPPSVARGGRDAGLSDGGSWRCSLAAGWPSASRWVVGGVADGEPGGRSAPDRARRALARSGDMDAGAVTAGSLDRIWVRGRASARARLARWNDKRWHIAQCAIAAGVSWLIAEQRARAPDARSSRRWPRWSASARRTPQRLRRVARGDDRGGARGVPGRLAGAADRVGLVAARDRGRAGDERRAAARQRPGAAHPGDRAVDHRDGAGARPG